MQSVRRFGSVGPIVRQGTREACPPRLARRLNLTWRPFASVRSTSSPQPCTAGADTRCPGKALSATVSTLACFFLFARAARAGGLPTLSGNNSSVEVASTLDIARFSTPSAAARAGQPEWPTLNDPLRSMASNAQALPSAAQEVKATGFSSEWRIENIREMTYSQFLILLREGHIESVKYTHDMRKILVTTASSCPYHGRKQHTVGLIFDPTLYSQLCAHGVVVDFAPFPRVQAIHDVVARTLVPLLIIAIIIAWTMTLGRKIKSEDSVFGGARLKLAHKSSLNATFDDVAGIEDIKNDILEIVSFLQQKERYASLGARAPAGVLLCGPPGTGKTLLAKAIAGEAGVPFYSTSGSDFSNVFAGVGASRVRDMFNKARENTPCILFIDEFDGIGQARAPDSSGDESNVQTINQLLTEMDGFEDNEGLVVLAATNRPAALDSALTRPGRFDRIINVSPPNKQGRVEMLRVHSRGKALASNINFERVARASTGYTGADIMNLMNVAAIEAVRKDRAAISEDDIFDALEQLNMDKLSGSLENSPEDEDSQMTAIARRSLATYVIGKALVGMMTPGFDEVHKVVLKSSDSPSGHVYFIPQDAHLATDVMTRPFLEGHLVVSLAGRVAENAVLGDANMTTASASDVMTGNSLCRAMIFNCAWSHALGPVTITDINEDTLSGSAEALLGDMSPQVASLAMAEMQHLMRGAEAKAYYGLLTNWNLFGAMVQAILESPSGILRRQDIDKLTGEHGLTVFEDGLVDGFKFDEMARLQWPLRYSASGMLHAETEAPSKAKSSMPDVQRPQQFDVFSEYMPFL